MSRTQLDVIRTCLLPQFQWHRPYEVESGDMVDEAMGWQIEVEWLGLYFAVAGGIFRPRPHHQPPTGE